MTGRAWLLIDALDRACIDGTILVVNDLVSDFLADQGTLREVTRVLAARAAERGMATLHYSIAGQVEVIAAPGAPRARVPGGIGPNTPPTVALDQLREACLQSDSPHLLIADYAEHVLPPDEMQSASGDTARIVEQIAALPKNAAWSLGGHRLVLIGRTASVDERIIRLPCVRQISLGLPQLDERRHGIQLMTHARRSPLHLAPGLDLDRAARLTGGIPLHRLSAMRFHTSAQHPLEVAEIIAHKNAAIRQAAGDTLFVHDELLDIEADVAGLPQLRRVLQEEQLHGSERLRLVLAGPPGNGKTRVSTAIGSWLGVPVLELGRIRARYVGDSEDNLRRALDAIEANAPAVLFIDEADQAGLGRRGESAGGEGSEVSANLRAALFAWLGDVGAKAGVTVIGATNRPDLLDEAATDRFTVVPVLHPSPWEAAQIMAIQARRDAIDFDSAEAGLALADAPVAVSGRQAVRLFHRAHIHALESAHSAVRGAHVAAAIAESLHFIGPEEERQSLLAVRATTWAGHLPWNAARHLGVDGAVPPAYLDTCVRPDGTLDVAAIDDRLRKLERVRGY
ncbi:ATP-binding protein [Leifsonia sp. EB34]|uniref:ATP-binding protein n=1 Tax=Leifsonia sp. EB34 TaxID=3156303 RepID=UPI00351452C8